MNFNKYIIAIGGSVIKTARDELYELICQDKVEMLIHNGGSIFHDFQIVTDLNLKDTSYPLDNLMDDFECNREASNLIWDWIRGEKYAPYGSITRLCEIKDIPVLLFTILGADFWQMFNANWNYFTEKTYNDFLTLMDRFEQDDFHFINLGSAVIHPEVFTKALAMSKPKNFKADVVDFLDMYRPRTRVAKYGDYFKMTHETFLNKLLNQPVNPE